MHPDRFRLLKDVPAPRPGPVVYWMSRDQRAADNWALLFARTLALRDKVPVLVAFCLTDGFLGATLRQYHFLLEGLTNTQAKLATRGIPLLLVTGRPEEEIPRLLHSVGAAALVTDFDPLRIKRRWKKAVVRSTNRPVYEVDAHNIVPCWVASTKQEYGAYTLRPKLNRLLPEYLDRFPGLGPNPSSWTGQAPAIDADRLLAGLTIDRSVPPVTWLRPGETAAKRALGRFLRDRLGRYDDDRNDPGADGQSELSPYLHFGQLSAQRLALKVSASGAGARHVEAFLEESIVRRELSDNFCYHNPDYDNVKGFPRWARETLQQHARDQRIHLYERAQLEAARTHDPIWNAAQREMVVRGKMHGYMRMYWAKKILEWSPSPEVAMTRAVYLNDRYELDGRDPNGYTGIAWSIGGVHDRAWGQRPIFGKVRTMTAAGIKRKFDLDRYLEQWGPES